MDRPRWERIRPTSPGSVMKAMTRKRPGQTGQSVISGPNTRDSRAAQSRRRCVLALLTEVAGEVGAVADEAVGMGSKPAGRSRVCWASRVLGTTSARQLWLAANTPW